jgi:DNA-binding SARP family transcriptional activator
MAPADRVYVRLLGPVDVVGAPGPFDRPKVVESLAYLTVHPEGASKTAWSTALWPDRRMSPNSLNTSLWQLRRALGADSAGGRRLPASRSRRLRLAAGVCSDLERFEALASDPSPASARQALELVRGRPFDGLGDPDWLVLEGHAARVESLVVATALRIAEAALDAGDPDRANGAARRAILASPYDERLYRVLMLAASESGNSGGVKAAMHELCRALGVCEPSLLSPATLETYRRLVGGRATG